MMNVHGRQRLSLKPGFSLMISSIFLLPITQFIHYLLRKFCDVKRLNVKLRGVCLILVGMIRSSTILANRSRFRVAFQVLHIDFLIFHSSIQQGFNIPWALKMGVLAVDISNKLFRSFPFAGA